VRANEPKAGWGRLPGEGWGLGSTMCGWLKPERWGEGEAAFSHRKRLGCERASERWAGNASVRSRVEQTLALACTCRRLPRSCDILGLRCEGGEVEERLV